MNQIRFIQCNSDIDYEKLLLYILDHRKEINANIDVVSTFIFLEMQRTYGENIVALDENDEVVASAAYVFGTPENNFADIQIVRAEMVFINQAYRSSFLFFKGLKYIVQKLIHRCEPVSEVQFFVPKENEAFNKVCRKFANVVKETTSFGTEILYSVEFNTICDYLRLKSDGEKRL